MGEIHVIFVSADTQYDYATNISVLYHQQQQFNCIYVQYTKAISVSQKQEI